MSGNFSVAELLEKQDWSDSPLGPPATWPDKLHTIVELILDSKFPMFIAWGPELGFLYNASYRQFLGDKHPSAQGKRFDEIWSEIWPEISPLIAKAMAGEASYFEDLPLTIRRNGQDEHTWFTFSYSPVRGDDGKAMGMYCAVTETTKRVQYEKRLAFQLQLSETVRELSSPIDIMEAAARLLGEYLSVGRVGYGEIDNEKNTVAIHRDWTDGTSDSLAGEVRPLDSFGPAIVDVLRRGNTLRLDNIASDPRSSPYAEAYASIDAQAMIVVPLLEAQQLSAVLYLHESAPRKWTNEDVELVEDVARRTWEAVKRARVEEVLRDETRILELINETGKTLASTLNLQTLLQSITDAATKLSGAKFGAFFYATQDEQGEALLLYTLSGAKREDFEKFGKPRATALFGPTFQGQAPVRSDDITQDERYGKSEPHYGMPQGHLPVRSYLAVPVISPSGQVFGGLFFGHPEPGKFTERTERIISGVAAQAGIAIDNARLYEAAQKSATERANLLISERSARSEAERLNRMKDEFLAMLAHELRNPLAPISSAAELLTFLYKTEPQIRRTSDIISRQVAHMARLIDDLLDVSRVTRGLITLNLEKVDFRDIVLSALDQTRPLVQEKRHQLTTQMPEHPVCVNGDETRLVQAVANILNNAVKYTPAGGRIEVELKVTGAQLELHVKDNGSGMPPELTPHVFDLFTQGKRTLDRSQGGLGLGLTLVKTLVALHGGTVSASSAGVDQGSEFTISLPTHELKIQPINRHHDQQSRLSPIEEEENIRHLQILVVDDNIDAANSLATLLSALGHSVATVYNAQDALKKSATEVPDVFLLDIGLPDLDGYELAARLRQIPQLTKSTLIALTGYGNAQDQEKSRQAGFAYHLVKPVDIVALNSALKEIASAAINNDMLTRSD